MKSADRRRGARARFISTSFFHATGRTARRGPAALDTILSTEISPRVPPRSRARRSKDEKEKEKAEGKGLRRLQSAVSCDTSHNRVRVCECEVRRDSGTRGNQTVRSAKRWPPQPCPQPVGQALDLQGCFEVRICVGLFRDRQGFGFLPCV